MKIGSCICADAQVLSRVLRKIVCSLAEIKSASY